MATMDFGKRVPRPSPIRNPVLTREQREFEGEVTFFLQHAAWRIDRYERAICSSSDTNDLKGPMLRGLRRLLNKRVASVAILGMAGDLRIEFEGGFRLLVFCIQTNADDDTDNYSVHDSERVVAMGPKGRVVVERKKS